MPTVKMPRADWESVIMSLEIMRDTHGWLLDSLIKEISDQVYSQEY